MHLIILKLLLRFTLSSLLRCPGSGKLPPEVFCVLLLAGHSTSAVAADPVATADKYTTAFETRLVVNIAGGLLANDTDADGDTLTVVMNSDVSGGTLSLLGDGSFTYVPDSGFNGIDSFDYIISDGSGDSSSVTVKIAVGATGNSVFDLWYGSYQSIGNVGQPQVWANVAGNVSDPEGIARLSYSLNGGTSQSLTVGPDGKRLSRKGDFNVDLDRADLLQGHNSVEITALDSVGSITSTTVTVNYSRSTTWPQSYEIDWSQTSSIQDAVEVVDGHWEITADGIRTAEPGYDRLLAIGDLDQDQYELVSSFTLHGYDVNDYAGVGLLGPWSGHSDLPFILAGRQPVTGFLPYGGLTWLAFFRPALSSRVQSSGYLVPKVTGNTRNFHFSLEQKYNFRYRVEQVLTGGLQYSARVWPDGQTEPTIWDVQYIDTTSSLTNGSILLIAHQVDVTFGDVTVAPVPERFPVIEPPPDNGIDDVLVHLTLDDSQSPSVATDSSGNENHGTISGASYVFEAADDSLSSLAFEGGNAVNLAGLDVDGSGVTLAAWFKADSFTNNSRLDGTLISKADALAPDRHVFLLSTTRRGVDSTDVVLRGRVRIAGRTATFRANAGLLYPGTWYHAAMVYDGSAAKLYLDGVEVFSDTLIGTVDRDSNIDVSIGALSNRARPWDGLIDDVYIAERGFSASEIAQLARVVPDTARDGN